MKNHGEIEVRVRYSETDQMGVVYHSNYLNYLELSRVEWLRELGFSYAELEKKGVLLPVVRVALDYRSPARYDELLRIETRISEMGGSSIEFQSAIYNQKGTLLVKALVKLVCIHSDTYKPMAIPVYLRELIEKMA
ncbi:MAG: thioesterase family protein [Bacteroidetes bacterium]|nr:thioesterase family protein [Bacteroidota bacterium]